MTGFIVFTWVLFVGLYFIWRGERNENRAKVIKMDLDEHEEKIS